MIKIIGTRGIGKSSKLLQYAAKHGIQYVVCPNPKHHIELAKELGLNDLIFISYTSCFIDQLKADSIPFVIDDVELFFKANFPSLKNYTLSIDD